MIVLRAPYSESEKIRHILTVEREIASDDDSIIFHVSETDYKAVSVALREEWIVTIPLNDSAYMVVKQGEGGNVTEHWISEQSYLHPYSEQVKASDGRFFWVADLSEVADDDFPTDDDFYKAFYNGLAIVDRKAALEIASKCDQLGLHYMAK